MTERSLVRRFVVLRALRWLPLGVALPFFVLLPQDRGLGLGEVGLVFGVHSVFAIVFEVPSGGLADAIGRRATLVAGGLLTVASLATFAVASSIVAFMLATATLAIGRALMSGALEAWFVDELRRIDPDAPLHRPLAAGSTAEGLGSGAGAAIGGFVPLLVPGLPDTGDATLLQFSAPFLAGALAALVYVAAVLRFVTEPRRRSGAGWAAAAAETVTLTRAGLGVARRSYNVRLLLCVAAGLGLVMSTTELLWQPRLEHLLSGDTADFAPLFGGLTAVSMLAFSAGSALSPRVARRTGKRHAYAGAFVLLAVALALLAAAQSAVLFCLVFLVYFASIGVADPLHYEVLHDAVDGSTRATVASAEGLASQTGGIGGNVVLTPLAGAAGIAVAWSITAVVALAAAALAAATRAGDRSGR